MRVSLRRIIFTTVEGFIVINCLYLFGVSSWAGFPAANTAGSTQMVTGDLTSNISCLPISGVGSSLDYQIELGYLPASQAAYITFLSSQKPLPAQALSPAPGGSRLVPSPQRRLTLQWSSSYNGVPVTYRLFVGPSPTTLAWVADTTETSFEVLNLEFLKDYYWQIESIDFYGRSTLSPIFNFSISPGLLGFYSAPNPFRPGKESTNFMFNMPGAGDATLKIFSLPHNNLVFETTLSGLQNGPNVFAYDGKDGQGQFLFNGVYDVRLESSGTDGSLKQKFLMAVVR